MLKISVVESPRRCRLVVEGILVEPWAAELLSEYTKAKEHLDGRELVIDVTNLSAISGAEGRSSPGTDRRSCQIPLWRLYEASLKATRVEATVEMNLGKITVSTTTTRLHPLSWGLQCQGLKFDSFNT
jgi:hypothetical protein